MASKHMKLLLTSAGITNKSLVKALKGLVREPIKIAFIPTAADTSVGDKDWLIKNYNECRELGTVDIIDVSAIGKKDWLPRLKWANVIVMGGGSGILHLRKWLIKSGLKGELPKLLKTRAYVGISAGSIITAKRISTFTDFIRSKNPNKAPPGLGYVNFNIKPHFNTRDPKHSWSTDKYLSKVSKKVRGGFYALDDNSAVLYSNGKVKVISEGSWKKYN